VERVGKWREQGSEESRQVKRVRKWKESREVKRVGK
jgi:hypothetical protein